jgi:hypothetical protein
MHRFLLPTAIGLVTLGLTGCATMSVSAHVERGLDFAQYRTYDWGPPDALPVGDPRLDKNPFFQDRFQGAVERQLAARGFAITTSGTPDLRIHYHASTTRRIDASRVDLQYGYCYDESCRAKYVEYEAGTLVLDVVDSRTNRVIWRGWAQNSLEGVLDDRDRLARNIDEAVKRMIDRLPGSPGGVPSVPVSGPDSKPEPLQSAAISGEFSCHPPD